jgi:hypothetical protein
VDGAFQQTGTPANCPAVGVQRKNRISRTMKKARSSAPGLSSSALPLIQLAAFFLFDFMKKVPAAEQPKIISLPQSKREKVLSIRHCPSHK